MSEFLIQEIKKAREAAEKAKNAEKNAVEGGARETTGKLYTGTTVNLYTTECDGRDFEPRQASAAENKPASPWQSVCGPAAAAVVESGNKKTDAEIKNEAASPFSCKACGSLELWLPRVAPIDEANPANWRCVTCKKPPNASMVLKRRGPLADASRRVDAEMRSHRDRIALDSIVVAAEVAACGNCKSSWVREIPSGTGTIEHACYLCGHPIDMERIEKLPAVERRHFAIPFLKEKKHGSGDILRCTDSAIPGQRGFAP